MQENKSITITLNIVQKGELLRLLYLINELIMELSDSEETVGSMSVKKYLNCNNQLLHLHSKIEDMVPLIERELPEWAIQLAKQTYKYRERGFVIWDASCLSF